MQPRHSPSGIRTGSGPPARAPEERNALVSRVRALGEGLVELELRGALPADWALRLARACAVRQLSLLRGYGRRSEGERWAARLEIDASQLGAPAPDFARLALRAEPVVPLFEPRLLDVEVSASPEAGGALEVEVHAWEAVGLLAGVLGRVARTGLVPVAIALETEGECAFHSLRLRRDDLRRPRARQQRALSRELGQLVRGG